MHWIVWPNIRTRLNASQIVKNKNAIIENGRTDRSLVCSLFLIMNTAPSDASTSPNSRGWCDQEISPSIPKRSCDRESPNPEMVWIIDPIITSRIPVFRDPETDFLYNRILPRTALIAEIVTPV